MLDDHLRKCAESKGAEILQGEKVEAIDFSGGIFTVITNRGKHTAPWLIGAFGKRSVVDRFLDRPFMNKRSPYVGVKYHVSNKDIPPDTVALHNFNGGYCGINAVENGNVNICYLAHRNALRESRSIAKMEAEILFRNPKIKIVFKSSEFLWDRP
ncbi:MAG: FAD-dependent oxidoreductase, partial [Cyclobacteriaceae bacterium]